jgi:hypothetical protein
MDLRSASAKALWTCLLVALALGYGFAAGQIYVAAGLAPSTVVKHFQGDEAEMTSAMTLERLVMLSHVHLLTMPWAVFPAALIFTRVRRLSERLKAAIIVTTFTGQALDIGSWWGVRFLGAKMLPVLYAGGGLFGAGLTLMTMFSLIHIWRWEE